MARLNPHAFKILDAEVKKCGGNDRLSQIERDIVLQELEKLRSQNGPPASLEELRKIVITTYPNFSEKSLNAAAKANRPASVWGKIKFTALLAVGTFVSLAAVGALLKVPKTAENQVKVLMAKTEEPKQPNPARMSTEDNYRQGMALVEQGERLIEQGTGSADLTLAEEKLNRAKKHIDRLPVSHYSYDSYRSYKGEWRSYRQKVYEDQFASIRAKVERLQTQLFQEQQAQAQLKEVEDALNIAQAQYRQAQTSEEKSAKLASWQAGMDRLKQIPSETLAGKTAQAKLIAYERDFQQFSGIEAAKQFAMEAAKLGQNPPHLAAKWEQIENQWEEAINRLEQITDRESGYIDSQKLLATYKTNLGIVQMRQEAEQSSVAALEEAKSQIKSLLAEASTAGSGDRNRVISQIQSIIYELQKVKSGTTAYTEAQELLRSAQQRLKEIQPLSLGN